MSNRFHDDNRGEKPIPQGWQCPKCRRIYGAHVNTCPKCSPNDDFEDRGAPAFDSSKQYRGSRHC